jgi:hypothetical protein
MGDEGVHVMVTRLRSTPANMAPIVALPVRQLPPLLQLLTERADVTRAFATPPLAGARSEIVMELSWDVSLIERVRVVVPQPMDCAPADREASQPTAAPGVAVTGALRVKTAGCPLNDVKAQVAVSTPDGRRRSLPLWTQLEIMPPPVSTLIGEIMRGAGVGELVGTTVGGMVGAMVGCGVGATVGTAVGSGAAVGTDVGTIVGSGVGSTGGSVSCTMDSGVDGSWPYTVKVAVESVNRIARRSRDIVTTRHDRRPILCVACGSVMGVVKPVSGHQRSSSNAGPCNQWEPVTSRNTPTFDYFTWESMDQLAYTIKGIYDQN